MKLILILLLAFTSQVFASQRGEAGLRGAVPTPAFLDTSITNVTSGAYVTLVTTTTNACSGILLQNTGAQPLKLAVGAAASEVDLGVVLPIGNIWLFPHEIKKGVRLSVRSMNATQSAGMIIFACYQ